MQTSRCRLLPGVCAVLSVSFWLSMVMPLAAQAPVKPNIVCIVIDDLNDYTSTLRGHPQCETPNVARIESWGTSFTNAHCSSPRCAPSRASFMTGKDTKYTQIYNNNACKPFRDYFTPAKNNEEVFTIPEYLKDNGGYFTYGIEKIEHCHDTYPDYDTLTTDACAKSLSWNKFSWFYAGEDAIVRTTGDDNNAGVESFGWSVIPDSLEPFMYDYRAVDSAAHFFDAYASGDIDACGRPFFMMLGFRKPHVPLYIPEKYFDAEYVEDYFQFPLDIPYNEPVNAFPYNGFVMPPQPDTLFDDFFDLPETGLAQYQAEFDSVHYAILNEIDNWPSLPEIATGIDASERSEIAYQLISANAAMAYVAAVRFMDAQVGRLIDSLAAYPELFNNTIFIFTSDHGFSLGEKRHWKKGTLWETDQRVPLVIADMRAPIAQQVHASVSLLDLFPTICALTETPEPVFLDGSAYLDGRALQPLMDDPDREWTRPAVAAFKQFYPLQLGCNPAYSVRDNRFHYIHYRSNGAPDETTCDPDSSFSEEELYEIGNAREVDPNEWHNLANDPAYAPVIDYLQQWLPDSALYLRPTYSLSIHNNTLPCLLAHDDTLLLEFSMYDTLGLPVAPPPGLTYAWTTDVIDTVLYGTGAIFLMSALPDDVYADKERMIWYIQAIDAEGTILAMDMGYYYFNPVHTPEISFSIVPPVGNTMQFADISITGTYGHVWWDLGDGTIVETAFPDTYTYAAPGSYWITCYVQYGNDASCVVSESVEVATGIDTPLSSPAISVFPNPTDGLLHIELNTTVAGGQIFFYALDGALVYAQDLYANGQTNMELQLPALPAGMYHLKISAQNFYAVSPIVIVPHK